MVLLPLANVLANFKEVGEGGGSGLPEKASHIVLALIDYGFFKEQRRRRSVI